MSKNYDDTENYCKDCDRSIYGKYPSCDINIENNGKYTKPGTPCYCKCREGVGMVEKYPWEKGEPMEKSRAIELLKLAVPIKALTQQEYADFVEAVNMGMDALEQPTSLDTIDRKAALDALRRCQTYLYDARDTELKIELSSAEAAINNLPTIQPVATDTNVGNNSEIPNSSDAISRQWLLDCINDGWIKFDTDKDANRFIHLVRDIAPTIQPEPQWIPCEERLPEKTPLWETVGYLATVTCDSWEEPRTMYVKWETTTVRGKEVSRWTFDNRLFPSEWRVVAWMPMPEAYKEGGEKI